MLANERFTHTAYVETETGLMAPKKKPEATDTDPPDEARPDTIATPLLVEDGKLLSPTPAVEFIG